MKKKLVYALTILLAVGFVATEIFVVSAQSYGYTDPDDFETNLYLSAMDIWVNMSSTVYGLDGSVQKTPQLKHVMFVAPAGKDLEWKFALGSEIDLVFNLFENGFQLSTQDDETGYTNWQDRFVSAIANFDPAELGTEEGGTIITVNSDYLNVTTEPTASNITYPDSDSMYGTKYEAGDGKSLNEYAKDYTDGLGETFYNTHNASFVAFSPENYDDLGGVVVDFDEETSTSLGILKRFRVWLHQRKLQRQNYGATYTTSTWDTVFRSTQNSAGVLETMPVGAKYFAHQPIGSSYFAKSIGTKAIGLGLKKSWWKIALTVGIIGGLAFIMLHKPTRAKVFKKLKIKK